VSIIGLIRGMHGSLQRGLYHF